MTADPWAARLPCDVSDSQGVYKEHTPVPHGAACSGAAQQPVCLSLRLSVSLSVPQHCLLAPECVSSSHPAMAGATAEV